jgi:hypothetical protein
VVLENKIKVMVKVLLMDHNQKAKDQDHQRASFPEKMKKVKVRILDLLKIKMENQSPMVKIAKTEILQNQIVKMERIQNSIITMAMNPQKDNI